MPSKAPTDNGEPHDPVRRRVQLSRPDQFRIATFCAERRSELDGKTIDEIVDLLRGQFQLEITRWNVRPVLEMADVKLRAKAYDNELLSVIARAVYGLMVELQPDRIPEALREFVQRGKD